MTEYAPQTTFLSLPTELRLQIAAYALEQSLDDGPFKTEPITYCDPDSVGPPTHTLSLDPSYTATSNLSILLVCRQFRDDFRCLALQKTWFLLTVHQGRTIAGQTDELLRNVRKIAISCGYHDSILSWYRFPFNNTCMKLDELTLSMFYLPDIMELVRLLRRLQNVKVMRILPHVLDGVRRLFGAILKEDHFQRYDARNAPNLPKTWWEWSYNQEESGYILVAQDPKPVMEEEDYMRFVKPLIDELMQDAAGRLV